MRARNPASEIDEHAYQELVDQLRVSERSKADQEILFTEERNKLQSEISRLKSELEEFDGNSSGERERADHLERELHQARAQIESETTARRIMEERHRELLADIDNQRKELTQALAEATCQTRTAEILRQQLAQARSESEDVKTLEARNVENMTKLLEDQEETLHNLENARSRGEDLEAQIGAARKEAEEVQRALEDARREKDRLLRQQASEHDRQMRDYVAEADGDRAVLEHQFLELRAELEDTERQLKEAASQIEMREADNVGLREELQRVECDLRDAQHIESALREDLRVGQVSQSGFEQKVEEGSRLVAQLLDVAIAYRTAHFKALTLAQAAISHPSASKSGAHLGDSQAFSSLSRLAPLGPLEEPSPIDPSDPTVAIEALRSFDHDQFLEAISKTGSTIRKWQKQCKEYRERAKGKISFRNFAKGDLALFLPTRNSVSKPWAAFNGVSLCSLALSRGGLGLASLCDHAVLTPDLSPISVSFPHYFLQANGYLAEQLKTREWIVARITSITERVVDQKVRAFARICYISTIDVSYLVLSWSYRILALIPMALAMVSSITCLKLKTGLSPVRRSGELAHVGHPVRQKRALQHRFRPLQHSRLAHRKMKWKKPSRRHAHQTLNCFPSYVRVQIQYRQQDHRRSLDYSPKQDLSFHLSNLSHHRLPNERGHRPLSRRPPRHHLLIHLLPNNFGGILLVHLPLYALARVHPDFRHHHGSHPAACHLLAAHHLVRLSV